MAAARRSAKSVETEFINEWADAHGDVELSADVAATMDRVGVDLVDFLHIFRTGTVIESGMTERRGLWVVRGVTVDEEEMAVSIAVSGYTVEVLGFEVRRIEI